MVCLTDICPSVTLDSKLAEMISISNHLSRWLGLWVVLLHGIFLYLHNYVHTEQEGSVHRLRASLNKTINTFKQKSSNMQHECKAMKISGIPLSGYFPKQYSFIKSSSTTPTASQSPWWTCWLGG